MYRFRSQKHFAVNTLLVCALLLRVAVPAGFMPSEVEDGWFIKPCHGGMSVQAAEALYGEQANQKDTIDKQEIAQCDLGSALSCETLASDIASSALGSSEQTSRRETDRVFAHFNSWLNFHSRAPPHSSLI